MPVVGYLGSASPDAWAARLKAFREGLSEAGFDEGRNVTIEYRWAEGNLGRLRQLARELVGRNVAVLVTPGSAPAALAAKEVTTMIPIVFETGADPVEAGIVTNLRHPGGNITGVAALTFETGPKRLAILHEVLPSAALIAVLVNPAGATWLDGRSRTCKQPHLNSDFNLPFCRRAMISSSKQRSRKQRRCTSAGCSLRLIPLPTAVSKRSRIGQ